MNVNNQFVLLFQRRFAPFFWTQFLGALNDNVLKTALVTILTFDTINWTTMDVGFLNQLIPGLFILPFVLFSASAGQIAEKVEKGKLARYVKLLEIAIMLASAYGWYTHSVWLLIAGVAGMGLHSTLFGPMKHAYLPQHLNNRELTGGNGMVQMGTFVGILLGQIIGAALIISQPWGPHYVAYGTIGVALFGAIASCLIPHSPASAPELKFNWNPISETIRNIKVTSQNKTLLLAIIGNSWFWFYGAFLLAQFPQFAKVHLNGDYSVFVLLLAIFSIGVGTGSLACEKLSGRKIEMGLVPLGAIGVTIVGFDLFMSSAGYVNVDSVDYQQFLNHPNSWHILFDIALNGIFGGVYIVPLFSLIQTRCDPLYVSRTIAGMNVLNSVFMVAAALSAMVMLWIGLSIPQLFLANALLNLVITSAIFIAVPEFWTRFVVWILRKD